MFVVCVGELWFGAAAGEGCLCWRGGRGGGRNICMDRSVKCHYYCCISDGTLIHVYLLILCVLLLYFISSDN